MRCFSPLDSLLCRVDKHFLQSYNSYDSTTITRGLLLTSKATKLNEKKHHKPKKFLSPLNEMLFSTRQFTLSGGKALSLVVQLVWLDYHYTGSLANITSNNSIIHSYHADSIGQTSIFCVNPVHGISSTDSRVRTTYLINSSAFFSKIGSNFDLFNVGISNIEVKMRFTPMWNGKAPSS